MSLFVIADLHLSISVSSKTMDIFKGWENYTEILEKNWTERVRESDTVVIPGDISWCTTLDEGFLDFQFIENLPGKKIILKGNHDYWFAGRKKFEDFLAKHGFCSMALLHNNSIEAEGVTLCGTRGWINERSDPAGIKIIEREALRLEASIKTAKEGSEIIVFLHYPPLYGNDICEPIFDVLKKYNIKKCYYGHLHGPSLKSAFRGYYDEIFIDIISADYLKFNPLKIL